jgi:hypothetical protein
MNGKVAEQIGATPWGGRQMTLSAPAEWGQERTGSMLSPQGATTIWPTRRMAWNPSSAKPVADVCVPATGGSSDACTLMSC